MASDSKSNKVIMVTGAAGGLGNVISHSLAQEGYRLVLADYSKENLDMSVAKLGQRKNQLWTVAVDVSDPKQVAKMVKGSIRRFSRVDALVNAAGIYGPIGPFSENDISHWIKTININLIGSVLCARAVIPFMVKKKKGKIINFSGGGASQPFPNFSAYSTSKVGVVRLTETLAEELKNYNIQVNAIAPGAINTKMLSEALAAGPQKTGQAFYKKIKQQKKRGGDSPQLSADLILFLLSARSFNLSGKLISAKWDNWRQWGKKEINAIMSSSIYSLRRIDGKYFFEK